MDSSNKSIHYFRDAHFIYANLFNANIEDPEIVPDLIWVFFFFFGGGGRYCLER